MEKRIKIVSKTAEERQARRVCFVASSSKEDRHGESVDVKSLKLPLKGGGFILAGDIPSQGNSDIDIPLMLNHSQDVCDVIGSVKSAFFENGELIFEAEFSKRKEATDVLKLLEEGHLSNAFSITMANYDLEDSIIKNAEVIEVSLVFRGANREARLLSVKHLGGVKMEENNQPEAEIKAEISDAGEIKKSIPEAEPETGAETEQDTGDSRLDSLEHRVEGIENKLDQVIEKLDEKEEVKEEEEPEMEKHLEKGLIKEPKQVTSLETSPNYLKTKSAMTDFADVLLKSAGKSADTVKSLWQENLVSKGISNPEKLLPEAVIKSIEDAFDQGGDIFKLLNKTGLDVFKVMFNTNTSDTSRAQGHKKGTTKKEQVITLADRTLRPQFIYKYIQLDKETLYENRSTNALVKYVLKELPQRIITEIERAVVIGDGRGSSAEDKIKSFKSIKEDTKNSGDGYGLTYETGDGEGLVASLIKANAKIKASGAKYLVTTPEVIADLQLSETKSGNLILPLGTNLAATFGLAGIFTPEWFNTTTETENLGYIFVPSAYGVVGDTSIEAFTNFSLKENKHEFLQEVYIGGGLIKPASAVAIKKPAPRG